jgi:KDO2-lipid IV(A) lauroyltransferase
VSPGRARVALFKGLGGLLEALPLSLDTLAASQIAAMVGRTTPGSRDNLRANLQRVLERDHHSLEPSLLERYVDRGFQSYGHYWAEGAKLPAVSVEEIERRFVISEGLEHLRTAKAAGKGVIIALPHIGSWEWGGAYLARIGLAMTAVAEELEPPELFQWFKAKREAIGIHIEPLDDSAGTVLLHTLREGGVVGLLCDRDIQGNGIEVEFFGRTVTMPAGPATLALRTGATICVAACYTGPGEGHHAVVCPPIDTTRQGNLRDDVRRCTQGIATELEGLIRRAPEQWHVLEPRFAS